jgi:glycosyltransferase involved in cell wall biosynthesis
MLLAATRQNSSRKECLFPENSFMRTVQNKLPLTVVIAAKNEEANMAKCLDALAPAQKIVVLDSGSTDRTGIIAEQMGAEVVQFRYTGGYPKKRQWLLDQYSFETEWVFFIDADEVVPVSLWQEISDALTDPANENTDAFIMTKGFHFMGKKFRFGGFSHKAVLLFRKGKARFEHLINDPASFQDMEVHERLIVNGQIRTLHTPLIHEDFKGLSAYIDRHNKYSTWEAAVRSGYLSTGHYGKDTIQPRLFGNPQERRRFLKAIAVSIPFEPYLWFLYHYIFKLGFLEGKRGLVACQIRSNYIAQVRAKIYEMKLAGTTAETQTAGFELAINNSGK